MIPKRVYTKINLDNIQKNIQTVRQKFGDDMIVMGIVKANGYGHGAVEVAKALVEYGAGMLGVAAIDEAVELRENGIKVGIVTSDSVQSTILTIKNFGWENLFDVVIGRESTKETKESGIPTKLALEKLNSRPENTVMIGDAPMDYISAKNAGVNRTILVATGQLTCDELSQTSEYVLKSLGELECSKI